MSVYPMREAVRDAVENVDGVSEKAEHTEADTIKMISKRIGAHYWPEMDVEVKKEKLRQRVVKEARRG